MSSPAPSSSAALREEELYGSSQRSDRFPGGRAARRPGMPKLQLPSQAAGPSSSVLSSSSTSTTNSSSSSSSSSRPVLSKLQPTSGGRKTLATGHAPLSLSIPSSHSFSGLHSEAAEEGHEGSEGVRSTVAGSTLASAAAASYASSAHRSIYPDTVPYGSDHQYQQFSNPLDLTNDLRRAIGGLDLDGRGGVGINGSSSSNGGAGGGGGGSVVGKDGGLGSAQGYESANGLHKKAGFPSSSSSSAELSSAGIADKRLSIASSNASSGGHSFAQGESSAASVASGTSTVGQELEEESELQLKGNLDVLNRLGEGASGEVRRARYRPTGLIMAMKTISTSPNPAIHRQILRELSFNRTCHSDFIVRYYGAFLESEDTSIVICMEQCEAGSLDSIYMRCKARNGRMGEKILAKIAESALKGLAYLHQRKIIHRDIKPSNILLTREGQVKLCDFGVSGELINSMAGTFTGTSYYMAPERIKGMPYNITSDVWSLGLSILEVASNRFPFPPEGEPPLGPIDLLSYIVTMKTPELHDDERSGIKWTRAFKDFLDNCLEKDGTKRHGPVKMLAHPFIKKSASRVPQPNLAKFVAEVWDWQYDSDEAVAADVAPDHRDESETKAAPSMPMEAPALENVDVPGIGRVASLRVAPSPHQARDALRMHTIKSPRLPSALPHVIDASHREHRSGRATADFDEAAASDRTLAKKREQDVGLVDSPC